VRIGNFSGFLGDRFTALTEILHGGDVDVVMGDYLAEATMAGISSMFRDNPAAQRDFFASPFLRQIKPELAFIAGKKIKVIVNAGAFNPRGLAESLRTMIDDQGLALTVAYLEGDDVLDSLAEYQGQGTLNHLDTGAPLDLTGQNLVAANAYLGGWGITEALKAGADIVIAGRVADASMVTGPAAWWHEWQLDDWNRVAGAVVAGHVIECGPQPAGGNFSGFDSIPNPVTLGFPVAEVAEDGSFVVTKHDGTGGAVTVDTVTAQLLYEIQGTRYLNPDVVVHIDTIEVVQQAPDRVAVTGIVGSAAPDTTKIGIFAEYGYKGTFFGFVTGLRADAKVGLLDTQLRGFVDPLGITELRVQPMGRPVADPASQWEATMPLYIAATADTKEALQNLHAAFMGLGLSSYPGWYTDGSTSIGPRTEYIPGVMLQSDLTQTVHLPDGTSSTVPVVSGKPVAAQPRHDVSSVPSPEHGTDDVALALGDLVYARSSDKGANSDLGVWTQNQRTAKWLTGFLTIDKLRELLNEPAGVAIERYELPNLNGLAFVLRGHLGSSGASNLDADMLSKALSEFLRAKIVSVPADIAAYATTHQEDQ
ncbi:MAG: acyclic terpene utilization AtuA family protein, partial [Rhodococcus fascians]